jgi:hypothetical protein
VPDLEHLSFPRLENIQRQQHRSCRERDDPILQAQSPDGRLLNLCDVLGRGTEVGGETDRLAETRRLK